MEETGTIPTDLDLMKAVFNDLKITYVVVSTDDAWILEFCEGSGAQFWFDRDGKFRLHR